jgi:putative tryptophan/tyrosine transport system substrate-binding protein
LCWLSPINAAGIYSMIRRRDLIAGLGGAVAWPFAANAQAERGRRVGVLSAPSESDPEMRSWVAEFVRELARLGWVDGRNLQVDQRWGNDDLDRIRMFAKELIELKPDAVLTIATTATAALQRETGDIPIVFAMVSDPVGSGFVAGLPRPGGNLTGFSQIEGQVAGKWLQMIREIAPGIRRAAAMYNPDSAPYAKYLLVSFESAARALGVEPILAAVRNDVEIETAMESLGRKQGGLIVLSDGFMAGHRATVIAAAARYKVPTSLPMSYFPQEGGLLSYAPNYLEMFRSAAGYVVRIFNGVPPADLPVQVPTRYELTINLRTAKALGLAVPPSILLRADEVIE